MLRFPSANRNKRFLFSFDKLKKKLDSLLSPFYWCLGPLHMSPANGLLGYRDECCCLFTWECQSRFVSFATIVRLCRLFQLYYYLCSGKTYQSKNYAISATVVGITKPFCQKMFRQLSRQGSHEEALFFNQLREWEWQKPWRSVQSTLA